MAASVREVISALEVRLDEPTAKGLATAVSRAIRDGVVTPGDRLPSIRDVARELMLSPTTVSSAWSLLGRAGTLQSAGRRGTIVSDAAAPRDGRFRQALEHHNAFGIDLSTGVPDPTLLPHLESAFTANAFSGPPRSYLDEPVLPELAEALAASWPYRWPAMTIVDGAMDALELIIRSSLRYGDRVIIEHPAFPPILDLLEASGISVLGVPLDDEGLALGPLADALRQPTQAIILQPRAHNPTGISISPGRLEALAQLLSGHNLLIIEDDSAGAISPSTPVSLGRWLPEQTVHIRSFSKSHGPDLRLAAMSGPAELLGRVRRLRQLGQGWSSRLLQHVLHCLLIDEQSQRSVDAARAVYDDRRRRFTEILQRDGITTHGTEGLNVWVPVRDESAALMRLASHGIGVAPGTPFMVLPEDQNYIRVTTGLLVEDLEAVAAAVADAAHAGAWGSGTLR